MLLKKVLGGNCLNVMLACLSPGFAHLSETINTLRYAERASHIVNSTLPSKNEMIAASFQNPMEEDEFDQADRPSDMHTTSHES